MPKTSDLSAAEIDAYDRIYREGGLRAMAAPLVHDDEPACPHNCGHRMEWIDFKLELHGDSVGIDQPLVRAFWDGTGFAGRCPSCGGWVRFRTIGMDAIGEEEAEGLIRLPGRWAEVAQFA